VTGSKLRQLVACDACSMQYDATALATGDRFRCGCGRLVAVPALDSHEAAVVRCSACGAPRQNQSASCSFCDSGFTLHERDLHTICPRCLARISDQARYCHSCALPIAPQAEAGCPTGFGCPACGGERKLTARRLTPSELSVLECGSCAGLWVGSEVFEQIASKAEEVRRAVDALGTNGADSDPEPLERIDPNRPLYRPCAVCGALMNRRNYGRKSGVIVDTCSRHGVWFDDGELARILAWLQSGGAQRARLEVDLERRQIDRHAQLYAPQTDGPPQQPERRGFVDLVVPVVDFLERFL
jgi:Zn-finger nucleic acid-binding protein